MKIYEIPELKIEKFMTEDLITTSQTGGAGSQTTNQTAVEKAKAESNYSGGSFIFKL